jgi:hypothetical protein
LGGRTAGAERAHISGCGKRVKQKAEERYDRVSQRPGRENLVSMRYRLEAFEERAMLRRRVPEAKLCQSDARRHMTEHLGRVAALRRPELDPEEAAEVEAVNAVFEGRLAQIRGEGRT